ncbi:hypothetical protein [Parvimonas parva]|uniref:Uncharacterized protein n=1 Tax=Parvimonas parva TaxID=2769485 RepID=A0ABS1CAW2_9FIRM|nr:hypothetical protein [Parvimonas parva]MBK1469237.1 hypothetical protein [Parvimonas parva]
MKKNNILILVSFIVSFVTGLLITIRSWYLFSILVFILYTFIIFKIEITKKNKYFVRASVTGILTPFIFLRVTEKIQEYIENGYYMLVYFIIFMIVIIIGVYKERKLDGYVK